MGRKKILIVEDEVLLAMSLQIHLQRLGYDVCGYVSSGEEALDRVRDENPDLVIMDVGLSGRMSGIEAAETILSRYRASVLFMTGYVDTDILDQIRRIASATCITKPLRPEEIGEAVEAAFNKRKNREESSE